MTCSEFLATLHAYFMGELAADAMARSDAHAQGCQTCGALMARARELSCREFTAFLDAYLDGALAHEAQQVFERHLEICSDCQNYLQSYRETIRLSPLAFQDDDAPPADVPDALIQAILAARPRDRQD